MTKAAAQRLAEALARAGASCRVVSARAMETPDLHRLTARGDGFWNACPHGGETRLGAQDPDSAAAEFVDAVQVERAMIARLYVEIAAAAHKFCTSLPRFAVANSPGSQPRSLSWTEAA